VAALQAVVLEGGRGGHQGTLLRQRPGQDRRWQEVTADSSALAAAGMGISGLGAWAAASRSAPCCHDD
jgi:hypothetical protein